MHEMFIQGFLKVAGGPGSGTPERNTLPVGMPRSPYISVGTRKGLIDNAYFKVKTIPLSSVTAVHQDNYVPNKLVKFVKNPQWIVETPIVVLEVGENDYHLVDGMHRYIAAKRHGLKELKAKIYKKSKKTIDKKES